MENVRVMIVRVRGARGAIGPHLIARLTSMPLAPIGMNQQTFGKYQLLKKLATGGMAEVFLARKTGSEGFEKLCWISVRSWTRWRAPGP